MQPAGAGKWLLMMHTLAVMAVLLLPRVAAPPLALVGPLHALGRGGAPRGRTWRVWSRTQRVEDVCTAGSSLLLAVQLPPWPADRPDQRNIPHASEPDAETSAAPSNASSNAIPPSSRCTGLRQSMYSFSIKTSDDQLRTAMPPLCGPKRTASLHRTRLRALQSLLPSKPAHQSLMGSALQFMGSDAGRRGVRVVSCTLVRAAGYQHQGQC